MFPDHEFLAAPISEAWFPRIRNPLRELALREKRRLVAELQSGFRLVAC
jgi:hypothetical protein